MKNSFLSYTGRYKKLSKNKFRFYFEDAEFDMAPLFICPPVYDNPFKTVFSYDKSGMELVKDSLNSIIYPVTKSILEITSFAPKELLSTSNIKYDKGSKRVDNAFFAKIKGKDKMVLIDLEMEKKFNHLLTEKYFDYGNCLRRANNFVETWVFAFCIDDSKKPQKDKGSNSKIVKYYNIGEYDTLGFIQIYEIYLNDLYKNINKKISIFPNEIIQEEGKEWLKFFTITLWSSFYESEENYPIPSIMAFKDRKIKEAIDKINILNINDTIRVKILTDIRLENKIKEENEKNLIIKFNEGKAKGKEEGISIGYGEGQENGIQLGKQMLLLDQLEFFFSRYVADQSIENIEMIGQIPYSILLDKYGKVKKGPEFINELLARKLIL